MMPRFFFRLRFALMRLPMMPRAAAIFGHWLRAAKFFKTFQLCLRNDGFVLANRIFMNTADLLFFALVDVPRRLLL